MHILKCATSLYILKQGSVLKDTSNLVTAAYAYELGKLSSCTGI